MPNKSVNVRKLNQRTTQSKGDGLSSVGRTVIDKTVRDDSELRARSVHVPNTFAHGIQAAKRQLLGFIGQNTKYFINLVGRFKRECWETHLHWCLRHDELVDD